MSTEKRMKFNLNDFVYVRLTEDGKCVYRRYLIEELESFEGCTGSQFQHVQNRIHSELDNMSKKLKFQLWDLI